jgi:class 3 adenylate cyclase/tetratricopeptide (TPR) repeat protein
VPKQEERRVVSILFADLAGSTALGERLDPEDVRTLQGELFELVNAEVERYGGVTEKFVGDAILAVFGIPLAHEDDAERAVRAALAIRERFGGFAGRVRAEHGVEVSIRIGVNTGEVIAGREAAARGELMVSGDAVNVAARLQQLAEPGEVLVGERTRQTSQRAISYRDRGLLDAKGKSAPVRAWSALDAVGPLGTVRDANAPFVGRKDETALLRLAASRVERERSPQLVTVFGQAGVGKSRLVSEFVAGLDARVLVGRCVPYGDGITYLPLAEIAGALAGIREDEPTDVALAKLERAVSETVSEDQRAAIVQAVALTMGLSLPERSQGLGMGGEVRQALHDAWTKYLAALGRRELVVLVIEDIHWASEPLLDLLDDVLAGLEDTAVLIVCPSRPELLDMRPSWGTGRLDASSITLSPLSASDAESLLRALLGSDAIPDEVARRILAPAEGNPFFLEEMLAMLVEQGAIEERYGRWVEADRLAITSVPDSIHGVIAARLDLLESREREALRRCSVMGRVFWPSAVDVDDDLVASLGRRAIVSEQPESAFSGRREFMFKHALTHEVAYTTLPRYERSSLHRRVAQWLAEAVPERHAETTELIAFHYDEAIRWGEADEELRQSAFRAALTAGDAAARRGAYASAERLFGRALELSSGREERSRALVDAAQVDIHTSQYERALERLAEATTIADELGDSGLRADALGFSARAAWLRGYWTEALETSEAAVATLDGVEESPELARALARLSQIQMLRALPSAAETASRAIEVARRTNEPAAEANARINLFTTNAAAAIPSIEEMAEIVDLAHRAGAPDEAVRAVVNYLWSTALAGPIVPAEEVVTRYASQLERGLTSEGYRSYLELSLAALVYVPAGRWEDADAVVDYGGPMRATNRLVWLWLTTGQALRRGDLKLVDRHLPGFRDDALATDEPQRILPMVTVAMPRALLAGDRDEARRLADIVAGLNPNFSFAGGCFPIVRALAALGERDALSAVSGKFAPRDAVGAAELVGATINGLLARLDGDSETSVSMLASVEEELRGLGRHYDAACIALEVAESLALAGQAASSDDAQARALELLEPLGCVNPY